MRHAIDSYEIDLRMRELAGSTIERARKHLDNLLRVDALGSRELPWLTPARAIGLYERIRTAPTKWRRPPSVDTHRNALAAGKSFGRWCAKQGWLPADPFARVEPIGRRKRGKPQLHVDETRKLIDACFAERSRAALAVATSLMLGCGASEVVGRQVRDLDDAGRVLHVTKGKNRFRVRSLELPAGLREGLAELAKCRPSVAWLFGVGDLERPSRHWILWHCRRLCGVAKVPVVSVHGLRGTHATIALGAVSTSHSVAAALVAAGASLGHAPGSPITASTYAAPGSVARATQRAVLAAIDGGRR